MDYVGAFAIFAKACEPESISGAARALGLLKANVSRAESRLESTYKVNLLNRSTRCIALTEVGRTLHGYCLKVAGDMEEAGALIAAHRGIPAGISASRSVEKLRAGDFVRILPEYEIHNQLVLYALSTERT
jgi:LysR family transcriptional regulator, transcriptional activator for aaeXAB operon